MTRTRIVATVGPVTATSEKLRALMEAGVDVFRLNFSHGTHAQHGEVIKGIRHLAGDKPIAILQDLCGPKLRLRKPVKGRPGEIVELELPPSVRKGDPVLLAQGLSNLIDNALKYAPAYGAIEVGVQRSELGTVEIYVADNGPGIEEAEKSKVMQRFYRGDASRGTPGVGLGLSLVQAIAKLHGAQVDLQDNAPGLRAVITMSYDASATAARDSAPSESPAAPAAAPPTLATLP